MASAHKINTLVFSSERSKTCLDGLMSLKARARPRRGGKRADLGVSAQPKESKTCWGDWERSSPFAMVQSNPDPAADEDGAEGPERDAGQEV